MNLNRQVLYFFFKTVFLYSPIYIILCVVKYWGEVVQLTMKSHHLSILMSEPVPNSYKGISFINVKPWLIYEKTQKF